MNLINDYWLPVLTKDGQKTKIKPAQLSSPDVVELDLPRLDFQGAAYQLLIGLLQTTFAPKNIDEWIAYYETPADEATLQVAFAQVAHAFNVLGDDNGNSPRFMQDWDDLSSINNVKKWNVTRLFIDSPGENAIKKNSDFFVKRNFITHLSIPMAALGLYNLQINAPGMGGGQEGSHRAGLRGGGPMTTLVRPNEEYSSLWHKLWWNVINRREWQYPDPNFTDGSVFPWLAPTKVSDKSGEPIYRNQVHPLHIYWAMPRRIKLDFEMLESFEVDEKFLFQENSSIDNKKCKGLILVSSFYTAIDGNNYQGDWSPHPITPYRFNPKKPEDAPYSIKAQPGGITYKLWHMLTFSAQQNDSGFIRAKVLDQTQAIYNRSRGKIFAKRLWAFSYSMNKAKTLGFYSNELPIFYISASDQSKLLTAVIELHELTENIRYKLCDCIKEAWLPRQDPSNKPVNSSKLRKDLKAKMNVENIDTMFWQRSQTIFFAAVEDAVNNHGQLTSIAASRWLNQICRLTKQIFDEQVLATNKVEQRHMAQLDGLNAFLYTNKQLSAFRGRHNSNVEASLSDNA